MIGRMAEGDELRGLMRLWPHGVSVLTVDNDGDRMGVTLSSLVSLSLEPPLIGVSVGKQASLYELLRSAGAFAVSMLGSGQGWRAPRSTPSSMTPLAASMAAAIPSAVSPR